MFHLEVEIPLDFRHPTNRCPGWYTWLRWRFDDHRRHRSSRGAQRYCDDRPVGIDRAASVTKAHPAMLAEAWIRLRMRPLQISCDTRRLDWRSAGDGD